MAAALGRPLEYHLSIDTGMSRLGTRDQPAALAQSVLACRAARLQGLMTHFASAGNFASPQTASQVARFIAVREAFHTAGIAPRYCHMSSSIPVAYGVRNAWGNMVRPAMSSTATSAPLAARHPFR